MKLFTGFVLGLIVGLLVAPSSGTATRRRLVRSSRTYSKHAIEAVRQYLDNLRMRKKDRLDETERDLLDPYGEGTQSAGLHGI